MRNEKVERVHYLLGDLGSHLGHNLGNDLLLLLLLDPQLLLLLRPEVVDLLDYGGPDLTQDPLDKAVHVKGGAGAVGREADGQELGDVRAET